VEEVVERIIAFRRTLLLGPVPDGREGANAA